jgi:hypothetical protein
MDGMVSHPRVSGTATIKVSTNFGFMVRRNWDAVHSVLGSLIGDIQGNGALLGWKQCNS